MSEGEDGVETVEVQTAVTTPAPVANSQQPTASSQQPLADLGKVRELVLKAHPDVVPDLVAGSSVDELIASVEPARSAYQRIAEQVREAGSRVGEETVAAGRSREERNDSSTPRLLDSVAQPAAGGAGRWGDERGRAGGVRPDHQDRAGTCRAEAEVDGGAASRSVG